MAETMTKRYEVTKVGAKATFEKWIARGDGKGQVVVWENHDLGNPSAGNQYTSFLDEDGVPKKGAKPHWAYVLKELVSDLSRFRFAKGEKEVDRFRVAVQRGGGLRFDLTRASSKKVRDRTAKHGEDAYFAFDYETQECVIYVIEWET